LILKPSDRNLSLNDVTTALSSNNRRYSGGPLVQEDEYRVRTVSRSQKVEELEGFVFAMILAQFMSHVAQAQIGAQDMFSC